MRSSIFPPDLLFSMNHVVMEGASHVHVHIHTHYPTRIQLIWNRLRKEGGPFGPWYNTTHARTHDGARPRSRGVATAIGAQDREDSDERCNIYTSHTCVCVLELSARICPKNTKTASHLFPYYP